MCNFVDSSLWYFSRTNWPPQQNILLGGLDEILSHGLTTVKACRECTRMIHASSLCKEFAVNWCAWKSAVCVYVSIVWTHKKYLLLFKRHYINLFLKNSIIIIYRPAARSFFLSPLPLFFRAHFLLLLHKNIDIFMGKKIFTYIYTYFYAYFYTYLYTYFERSKERALFLSVRSFGPLFFWALRSFDPLFLSVRSFGPLFFWARALFHSKERALFWALFLYIF